MENGSNLPDSARKAAVSERPGVPRWVKVFGLIGLAVVVILVVLMLFGVDHGPGMHSIAELVPVAAAPVTAAPVSGTAL